MLAVCSYNKTSNYCVFIAVFVSAFLAPSFLARLPFPRSFALFFKAFAFFLNFPVVSPFIQFTFLGIRFCNYWISFSRQIEKLFQINLNFRAWKQLIEYLEMCLNFRAKIVIARYDFECWQFSFENS